MANGARQEYWGISCRSCMQMIAFAKVKYGSTSDGDRVIPEPEPDPFDEECPQCGFPSLYSAHELVPFEGPAVLGFIAHDAFVKY